MAYKDYSAGAGLSDAQIASRSNIGVPAGGTTGQVLSKKSAADLDTQWSTGVAAVAARRAARHSRFSTTARVPSAA